MEIDRKGTGIFRSILTLRTETTDMCMTLGRRAPNARKAMDFSYRRPILTAKDLEAELGVATPTANGLIQDFVKLGVLREITGQPRYRLFVFDRYLGLFVS